ncbi:MAG: hypothetical protein RMA76_16845 [Deltaproteobacteria bacterium]|jgi:hypothetical protein
MKWVKQWWWLVLALVTFVLFDRALHHFYMRCTPNDAVVRGEASLDALDLHPEIELLVIGDSSGRWGVNTNILTEELGVPAWNIATFHGAFPSQVTLIERAIERGTALKSVLIVHTENGQAKYIDHEGPEITLAYFLTPYAVRFWYGHDLIDASTALEWTWALASPSYRDGKGIEAFVLDLRKTSMQQLQTRYTASAQQRIDHFANRGHSRGVGKNGPGMGDFNYFIQVVLQQPWKFENHPDVDEWNERLLEITDRHGIKVFFALTPRMEKILAHQKWPERVGQPVRDWAKGLNAQHPTFELLAPDPFAAKADEFYDTADHLNAKGAERYSRWIVAQLRGRL